MTTIHSISTVPSASRAARVLHVASAPRGPESRTLRLAGTFFAELATLAPWADVTTLDLVATPPPVDTPTLSALTKSIFRAPMSEDEAALLGRWDPWIDLLARADLLVFTSPLWNYHAPANLRAFIDIVTQPGKAFRYTPTGPTGVLAGKRAVLFQTRGASGPDPLGAWLKDCLWLLGGDGLDVVKTERQDAASMQEQEDEHARAVESAHAAARRMASVLAERRGAPSSPRSAPRQAEAAAI